MRRRQQEHVAHVLAETRMRLEQLLSGTGDGAAGGEVDALMARLVDIEAALRRDAERHGPLAERAAHWLKPRLEVLRHHPAEPLRVPTSYLRTSIPSPPPRISVVTPSYDQAEFLERTLYSVLSQGYPALEYVVQDGGSSDGSVEIVRRHDRELAAWASEPDGGQADAINRGFARTTGEIMAYLNSDDLLLPGSLAYVARYFAAHPDVDAVYGNRLMIDERDGRVGAWVLPAHDDRTLALYDYVPQETLFWRRRAWEAAGGRVDESLRFALDWDLLLRMREAGAKMVHVRRFLGAFRVHERQKSRDELDAFHREAAVLLRRTFGRPMTLDEAHARARPYMRRHVVRHNLQRMVDRLPLPRSEVRTTPPLPGARLG